MAQGEITLDLADGRSLGVVFKKDPATGTGARVKSIIPGGQAEDTGRQEPHTYAWIYMCVCARQVYTG